MSHFTVAVISHHPGDIDELLAPFNEQTEEEQYLEFQPSSESMEELNEKFNEENAKKTYASECYKSFEDFLSRYYGYHIDPKTGLAGYTCNPNAKWDWYEIGGRWDRMMKRKNGIATNCAPISSLDLSHDEEAYRKAIRFWEVAVEGDKLLPDENEDEFFHYYKGEYYIDQYGTKEEYAKAQSTFSTWAFLTPEGEWVEQGSMGWWGMNDATKNSRRLYRESFTQALEKYSDCWLTIVDCHI